MMGIRAIMDGKHTTYGPYRGGDELEFTEDPVYATVSFDIFDFKVRDSKLYHYGHDTVACYNYGDTADFCVVTPDGKVGNHIKNLYFTFNSDMHATEKPDVKDEVNHPMYNTYGPYNDGDSITFTCEQLDKALVSFVIVDDIVASLPMRRWNDGENDLYFCGDNGWCVITRGSHVAPHIERLYISIPVNDDGATHEDYGSMVNHPKHYTGHKADLECIMFTELMPSLAANAFKYVWRCDDKGDKTKDLEKALWYLDRAEQEYYGRGVRGRKVRRLMLNILNGSDFDDWHELVLSAIIDGEYSNAYNAISAMIGKSECPVDTSLL